MSNSLVKKERVAARVSSKVTSWWWFTSRQTTPSQPRVFLAPASLAGQKGAIMATITNLESLEELAHAIVSSDAGRRELLRQMIRQYCRIMAVKSPEQFKRRALQYMDEPGHYDNSYPPEQQYADRNGPSLIRIEHGQWDEIASSGGFYYSWEAVTRTRGVYVDRHGDLYGADYSGIGAVGQFAAHPGDCGVDIHIEYSRLEEQEISTDQLREVEGELRTMAAPHIES